MRFASGIEDVCKNVDAILLLTLDGRPRLEQMKQILSFGKPVFMDKPVAASLKDAVDIYKLAEAAKVPVFSASAIRWYTGVLEVANAEKEPPAGAISYGPAQNGNYMMFSSFYGNTWIGYGYILLSHVLVFFSFQNISKRVERMSFEVKEIAKFFSIIVLGLVSEFIFRMVFDFLINKAHNKENYDLKTMFTVFLVVSFKFWVLVTSAYFFNNLVKYISSLRRKSKQLQAVTSDAQISADALQQSEAHVNTHFLYNSLQAIAALAPVAPDKTETLALSLAKYYRYTTNRNDEKWITIKVEVEAQTSYLDVEKIRLGEKLTYAFDVSDDRPEAGID